jgi:hypothetical protein
MYIYNGEQQQKSDSPRINSYNIWEESRTQKSECPSTISTYIFCFVIIWFRSEGSDNRIYEIYLNPQQLLIKLEIRFQVIRPLSNNIKFLYDAV